MRKRHHKRVAILRRKYPLNLKKGIKYAIFDNLTQSFYKEDGEVKTFSRYQADLLRIVFDKMKDAKVVEREN